MVMVYAWHGVLCMICAHGQKHRLCLCFVLEKYCFTLFCCKPNRENKEQAKKKTEIARGNSPSLTSHGCAATLVVGCGEVGAQLLHPFIAYARVFAYTECMAAMRLLWPGMNCMPCIASVRYQCISYQIPKNNWNILLFENHI